MTTKYKSPEAEELKSEVEGYTKDTLKGKIGHHFSDSLKKIVAPRCVRTYKEHSDANKISKKYSVSWGDDDTIITTTQNGRVCVFDAQSEVQKKMPISEAFVMEAAITTDGKTVATGGMRQSTGAARSCTHAGRTTRATGGAS